LGKNAQKEPWFLEINPNGRIPALTDKFTDGTPIRLFESGSIMQYLIDRYDTEHKLSYPHGSKEYYEVNNWVRERSFERHLIHCIDCATAILADGGSGANARPVEPLYS
jgi:glutathione S-transferase